MGKRRAPTLLGQVVHLLLRGRRPQTLVQTDDDWRALGVCAGRMLFWCGGCILGCRCDGTEVRFALQVAHAPIGKMAQHFSAAYAAHLWNRRRWDGIVFKHYRATPLADEIFLDDLVIWLHRLVQRSSRAQDSGPVFTADVAYITPAALPWINTAPVLAALGGQMPQAAYRQHKTQPIADEILRLLIDPTPHRPQATPQGFGDAGAVTSIPRRPSIEMIAEVVAAHCQVAPDDMRSSVRKRAASEAKVIATVLCTRYGLPAAAAARFFNRSRSTLTEQAERYRRTQPQIFTAAQNVLEAHLASPDGANYKALNN
jgi:hypothetical protein